MIAAAAREFSIVVYGATGFTGKQIVKYIKQSESCANIKWAIAGRSQDKLDKLKADLELGDIPVLIADTSNEEALNAAFSKTTLVLNCTGPYRFLGEPVVKACVGSKTHYMDICGEPQFMENMFLKYHDQAQAAGVLVLHACAFDSVPADLGFLFTMRQFKGEQDCSTIESFLTIDTGSGGLVGAGHYTTYECAVHGMGDVASLRSIRENSQQKYSAPKILNKEGRLQRESAVAWDERVNNYIIPFMGADASVVRSTARAIAMQRQAEGSSEVGAAGMFWPQYGAYACIGDSITSVAGATVFGGMFATLAGFDYGREILLAHPEIFTAGVFSHEGPTQAQLDETTFCMKFLAKGYLEDPKTHLMEKHLLESSVTGPEPGYVATPRIFIVLALNLLDEFGKTNSKQHLCMPKGGVFTPGAAYFHSETIFDKLNEAGIVFKLDGTLIRVDN